MYMCNIECYFSYTEHQQRLFFSALVESHKHVCSMMLGDMRVFLVLLSIAQALFECVSGVLEGRRLY